MLIRCAPIPNPLTIDEALPSARITTFAYLSATVVEGLRDVEAVDVPGDYARDEEDGVDYAIRAGSC